MIVGGDIDSTGGAVTLTATEGNLNVTAGGLVTAGANDVTLEADGNVTVTVSGTIATAGTSDVVITADNDTDDSGDATVTSTGAWTSTGGNTITITGVNVKATSEGAMAVQTITATKGNVTEVSANGITIGNKIEALEGQVVLVDAGGDDGTGDLAASGTIESDTATSASPLLTVIDSGVEYIIETSAGATDAAFDIIFTPGATDENAAAIIVTNTSGGSHDLSLRTVKATDDATDGDSVDTEFDLAALSFDAATIAANRNNLGNVLVEGDTDAAINLGNADLKSFVIQDTFGGKITVDSIDLVAGAIIGADTDLIASDVLVGTPDGSLADGPFAIPMNPAAPGIDVIALTSGTTFTDANTEVFSFGVLADADAQLTFSAGALTAVTGEAGDLTLASVGTSGINLSGIEGDVDITGDVDGLLTLNPDEFGFLTIGGDVSATGSIIGGDVGGVLTITGDVAGTIDLGDVGGNVSMGDVSADVTLEDITGTLTVDDVTADITTGDVTGAVTADSVAAAAKLEVGDTASVTIDSGTGGTGDMLGALVTGDITGNITIDGDFGSVILIDGDVGTISLGGVGGSATSLIGATGQITEIDLTGAAEDLVANIYTGGDGTAMLIDLAADQVYTGEFAVGQQEGVLSFNIDIDGTLFDVITFSTSGAAAGTAVADSDDEQTVTLRNVVLSGATGNITIGQAGVDEVNVTGNIYIGDTQTGNITVEGDITGMVIVDDDADVSAVTDAAAVFTALPDVDAADQAERDAFVALLPGAADNDLGDSFGDNASGIVATGMDITAFSLGGGLFIEGTHLGVSNNNSITTTDGDSGPITVDRGSLTAFDLDIDGNQGDVNVLKGSLTSAATWEIGGNLGDLTAESITVNMNVDGDAGTFTATDVDIIGQMVIGGSTFGGLRAIGSDSDLNGVVLDVPSGTTINIILSILDDSTFLPASSFTTDQVTIFLLGVGTTNGTGGLGSGGILIGNDSLEISATESVTQIGSSSMITLVDSDNGPGGEDFSFIIALTGVAAGESIDVEGSVNLFESQGSMAGTFEADVTLNYVQILGDWSGGITVNSTIEFTGTGKFDEIDSKIWEIAVIGNITATAALNVDSFDQIEATGTNSSKSETTLAGGDSLVIASNFAGVVQTIWIQGSSSISAKVTTVFNKVTEIALSGRGNVSIVSVNADLNSSNPDQLKLLKEIQSDARKGDDNAILLAGEDANVGSIVLATANTQGKLNIDDTVIDGDLDLLHLGFKSSAKNVTVTGNAGSLILGKTVNKLFVDGELDSLMAKTAKNVWIGDDVGTFQVIKASNIDIEGDVDVFNTINAKGVDITGDVGTFGGNKLNNVNVWGSTDSLAMSGSGASIMNSFFSSVGERLFNGTTGIGNEFDERGFLVIGDSFTKPFELVKIRNSFTG